MTGIRKFLSVFSRWEKCCIFILAFLMIIGSVLETITTALILPIMSALTNSYAEDESGLQSWLFQLLQCHNTSDFLNMMLILLAGIYIFKGIYTVWNTNIQQRFIRNFRTKMSSSLFSNIMGKPYAYHLQNSASDIQRIVVTDVEGFCSLVNSLINVLSELFTLILLIGVLMVVNPLLTVMAGLVIAISVITSNYLVMGSVFRAGHETRVQYKNELKCVNESTGGLKGIYVNNKQSYFTEQFHSYVFRHADAIKKNIVLGSIPRAIVESISMAGIFLVIAAFLKIDGGGESLLPTLAAFAVATVRLIPAANRINSGINTAQYAKASVDAVYDTLHDDRLSILEKKATDERVADNTCVDAKMDGIQISHVSFRYEDSEQDVLTDVSFLIPSGKSVAFIGTTGAGKSTLADLILGLHIPSSGTVTAAGFDVHKEKEWWGKKTGYIPQSIYLCDDTIRHNVAFGCRDDEIDDERVWKCLKEAQLDEFVRQLPAGIDTVTGENGVRLSGGQKQRIGIARAIYPNPDFLVLDEATSALDNDTESAIMDAINTLSKEKTLLIIAHRLTTIQDCDIVYRIGGGRVVLERRKENDSN